jgi:hypothetical protein
MNDSESLLHFQITLTTTICGNGQLFHNPANGLHKLLIVIGGQFCTLIINLPRFCYKMSLVSSKWRLQRKCRWGTV